MSTLRTLLAGSVMGALCALALYMPAMAARLHYVRSLPWDWVTTVDARPYLDNRAYFATRDSTRALVRRRYRGDTTTTRAQAYFAHMDSTYDPTYLLPRAR